METKKKQGKCYRYLKAIWHYKSSHMWCSFASAILLSVFLLFFITMWYMKDRFYKNLAETTYSTEQALLESVEMNIATQMEMYINYGSQISVDTELTAKIENVVGEDGLLSALERKSIRDTLSSAIKVSNTIVGIALVSKDGVLRQYDRMEMSIAGSRDIWEETNEDKLRMAFQEVQEMVNRQNVPRYYILTEPKCHPNDQSKGLIHIAYPLKDMHDYACMRYMLVLSFDSTPMEVLLKQLNPNKEKYIQAYVEDRDGEILMNTGMEEQNGDQQSGFHAQESSVPMERTQELCVTIGDYEWILHVVIDKDILQEKVNEMYVQMVFIVVMAILIIMLLLFFVTNKILRPVKIISSFISGVKDGNTREQIQIEGTNEIWQLAQEYNEMIHAIGQASDQVEEEHQFAIESMRMQQRAEREALESQINAHFICNTLNVINYEAIDSGNYKVSLLLKKLSNILRYTFDQKHQEVYIFQEISWIEQYLFLQKERMDGIFDYQIVFDVDYDNWPCRKLMLQPFVENSILHGFEGMACGGLVCIKGEGYKEFLKITIEDNGCGMDRHRSGIIQEILKNPLLAKDKEVGIGISNVITRMRMYYGEQFQVSMKTEEGKGTSFVFLLPMPPSVYEKETDDKQIQPEKYTAEDQEDIEEDMETEQGQERLQAENDRREVPDALGGVEMDRKAGQPQIADVRSLNSLGGVEMDRLRILIAEDEQRARRGLKDLILSLSDTYEVVAEIADGKQALEIMHVVKPDIVFTDLKMPYMSGLELIKAAKAAEFKVKFVIISAYEEFEVARQAISLGVSEYLVKPIMRDEVKDLLERLADEKSGGHSCNACVGSLKDRYPDAHPLVRKSLSFIEAGYASKISQKELAENLGVSQEYLCYLFNKDVGMNFSPFIRAYRIDMAKKLLLSDAVPKEDIPYQVGFSDSKYFHKVFREIAGISVADFLKQNGR